MQPQKISKNKELVIKDNLINSKTTSQCPNFNSDRLILDFLILLLLLDECFNKHFFWITYFPDNLYGKYQNKGRLIKKKKILYL